MTKRSLFLNNSKNSVSGSTAEKDYKFAESSRNATSVDTINKRLVPHVDYSIVDRFAKFGSAELYYKKAFEFIRSEYPYDGSEKEKNNFFLSLNETEKFVFEKIYPRENGYAIFSAGGWGSRVGSIVDGFGEPLNKEYIDLNGSPHTAIKSFSTKRQLFENTRAGKFETKQEIADREGVSTSVVPSDRKNNLQVNFNEGVTLEFWLKKAGFDLTKTEKEVIFDLSNGELSSSSNYGRLTLTVNGSGTGLFGVTLQSGTVGFSDYRLGTALATDSLESFKFYSIRMHSGSTGLDLDLYVDGKHVETRTQALTVGEIGSVNTARLGALIASPSGSTATAGSGKLSGSLDDFRYWKVKRTTEEIQNYCRTQVGGGANTDFPNTSLGVYYKFNEGITNTSSIDSKVLDYSGRINNGAWTGYSALSRNTGSAFIISGLADREFKDPVLNASHPTYVKKKAQLELSGSVYDAQNTSYIRNYFPQWMLDTQDDNPHLNYLTHIVGQYFDDLFLKIQEVNKLQNVEYAENEQKPYPTEKILLQSRGLNAPNLFENSTILNLFSQRDQDRLFNSNIEDIKNKIYKNLYNNLNSIYKSKGTLKSFRYLFNSLGVPQDLLKINLYSNYETIESVGNSVETVDNIKFIDLTTDNTANSVVYQNQDSSLANSLGYLSSSKDNTKEPNYGITVEASVNLPKINLNYDLTKIPDRTKEKSLFGVVQYNPSGSSFLASDEVNFQVYVEKEERNSKNAKFVLSSSISPNNIPVISSSMFRDVFDDADWHLAVSIAPSNYPFNSSVISGSDSHNYTITFQGQTRASSTKSQSFFLTSSVSKAVGQAILKNQKQAFLGAFRTNFTGSVIMETQAKFNMLNVWNIGLSSNDINNHASDLNNKSITNSTVLRKSLEITPVNEQISKNSTLALSWGFENVTGSNSTGNFYAYDESSGSANARTLNSWFGENYGFIHSGYGYGFPQNSSNFVTKEKRQNVTFVGIDYARNALQDIQTVTSDDIFFQRNDAPSQEILRLENSPYAVVSKDIVDYFGIFKDLNEHVGAPVQRYRHSYKDLRALSEAYFKSLNTEINVDSYFEYFKWFDESVTSIIKQIVPLSIDFDVNSPNTIESHILERNKFQSKYQNIKNVNTTFEGSAKGVNELSYNWKVGHAPIGLSEPQNSLWWQLRAEREDVLSTDASVDGSRETIRRVSVTSVSGSTFAVRNLTRPVRLNLHQTKDLKGGVNFERAKSIDFTYSSLRPAGPVNKEGGIFVPQNVLLGLSEDFEQLQSISDVIEPNKKVKRYAKVYQGRGFKTGLDYETSKNSFSFPFNVLSSSVDSGYQAKVQNELNSTNLEIANLHNDVYGPDMERPMQGPFTEQYVGGHQSRHVKLNDGTDTWKNRPEAWKLLLGRCVSNTEAIGMVGPDYPYPEANEEGVSPYPLTAAHKAPFYRDGTAKRSVNIANIKDGINLGNYSDNWQVVQTFGRKQNNRAFDKSPSALPARIANSLPKTTQVNSLLDSDFRRRDHFDYQNSMQVFSSSLENRSVIVNRFSAPGDQLTMTDSFLDYDSREFSSYNDLNHRNIVVRGYGHEVSSSGGLQKGAIDIHGNNLSMRAHLVRHTGRFGRDSALVSNPLGLKTEFPGFHKVHRNSITKVNEVSSINSVKVRDGIVNLKSVDLPLLNRECFVIGRTSNTVPYDVDYAFKSASLSQTYDTGFTFSTWFKIKNVAITIGRHFYSHGLANSNQPVFRIYEKYTGTASERRRIEAKLITWDGNKFSPGYQIVTWQTGQILGNLTGSFHHLAVRLSGSNGNLSSPGQLVLDVFIDGVQETVSVTGTPNDFYDRHDRGSTNNYLNHANLDFGGSSMFLGNYVDNSLSAQAFSGSLDQVSLWTKALPTDAIEALYNSGVPCSITSSATLTAHTGNLIAWYSMGDEGQDSIDSTNPGYVTATNGIKNKVRSELTLTPVALQGNPNNATIVTDALAGCPPAYANVETFSHECVDKFDNYFVVHSLPRTENQYSWITASYIGNCSGALNTGYQPYSTWEYGTDVSGTNPYQLVTEGSEGISTHFSSKNNEYSITNDTISVLKDSALDNPLIKGTQRQLNSLLNNYNGPYQAPSFVFSNKLGTNPIVKASRERNVVPYSVGRQSNTFISESVVSNHYPIVIRKTTEPENGQIRGAKVSYSVENDTFDSPLLRQNVRLADNRLISNTLYRNEGFDLVSRLPSFFRDTEITFKEQVYPSRANRYLEKTVKRDSYHNFFWRDSREERSSLGLYSYGLAHTNSRGFDPTSLLGTEGYNPVTSFDDIHRESIWPLDAVINFVTRNNVTSSIKGSGKPNLRLPVSGAGELQNQYSQLHNGQNRTAISSYVTPESKLLYSTILYSRKHDVASSGSVTHPTGLRLTLEANKTPDLADKGTTTNFVGQTEMFAGDAYWDAPTQAKVVRTTPTFNSTTFVSRTLISRPSAPWFDSYDEYLNSELEKVSKEYSIIPEYRISKATEENIKNGNESKLFLEIVNGTSSVSIPNNSSETNFFKTFSNSSFIKDYDKLTGQLNQNFNLDSITLECSGVMKFMPYDGFYPAQRTVQIAKDFNYSYSSSLDAEVSPSLGPPSFDQQRSFRPIYQTLFSPGILFNSIKSGIAVDYPVITENVKLVSQQITRSVTDAFGTITETATDYHLGTIKRLGSAWFLNDGGVFGARIPFEAILSPALYIKGLEIKDNEVHPSASLSYTASVASSPNNSLYNLSVNNFIASVQDFFLAPREQFEIKSKRFDIDGTQKIALKAGKTYFARITMNRSLNIPRDYQNENFDSVTSFGKYGGINPNNDRQFPIPQDPKFQNELRETFTMYSRPSAFGPPLSGRARIFNRGKLVGADATRTRFLTRSVSDGLNGFNWAYTPPYYHGEAWADLILHVPTASTAGEAARGIVSYTIEEIQKDLKIYCWRVDAGAPEDGVSSTDAEPKPGELLHAGSASLAGLTLPYGPLKVNKNAMHVTSSFDVNILRETKGDNITSQQWVIRPKFLTPMLNFNSYADNSTITTSNYGTDSIPRGMWHQFGLIPETNEGVYASIGNIPFRWLTNHRLIRDEDSVYNNNDATGFGISKIESLVDALGFDTEPKKLGVLKESKEVFEGIVAVPYISTEGSGARLLKYREQRVLKALKDYDNGESSDSDNPIIKTLKFARKFVLPELFDPFISEVPNTLGTADAIVYKMFFFEFKATLSKNDLSYIWQNLMPRDFEQGLDAKRIYVPDSNIKTIDLSDRISLSDSLELRDQKILNNISNIKWMVFKVKQRSVHTFSDFNKDVIKANTARRQSIDFDQITRAYQDIRVNTETLEFERNPKLAFNWPYDYLSLTEKVKINAKLKFKN